MDKNKKMLQDPAGNVYDRIFKENAERMFIPLIEEQLDIKIIAFEPLQEKIHRTIQREMDFFCKITTDDHQQRLLHIEFQTQDDQEMIFRMAEYHGLALRKYRLPIKHIAIFLGTGKAKMKTRLNDEETFEGFDLINIHELNTTQLLSSQIPEVVQLAILSNYEAERTEAILRLVVMRLKDMCKEAGELAKNLTQLILLSRLRKLEEVTAKIIQEMPITYDIQQDSLYKQGIEKGIAKGIEKGIEEGIRKIAIRCFHQKKSPEETALITGLTIDEVEKIWQKIPR
jgi:predicted transposase/invertase (TIGR01784 family)